MLQSFRNASQSWAVRIFFGLLVVAFALMWSMGDMFQGGRRGGSDAVIITVGSHKISRNEFVKRMRQVITQLPPEADVEAYKSTIKQQVLQQMLTQALLDIEVERLGLVVTDDQIRKIIRSNRSFLDQYGDYDHDSFKSYLYTAQITEKDFVDTIRHDLQRQQLVQAYIVGVVAPQSLVQPLYAWQHEEREVETLEILAKNQKVAPPTPEQIEAYYQEHPQKFTTPEQRDVTVLRLSEPDVAMKIKLTDEEISAGFAQRRGEFKGPVPTPAEIKRITDEIKREKSEAQFNEMITQVEDDLAGGATLDEISKTHDLLLIKLTQVQNDGLFFPTAQSASLSNTEIGVMAQQAFAGDVDAEISLAESDHGSFIAVRVDRIVPATVKPLAEVKGDVIKELTAQLQREALQKRAQDIVTSNPAKQGLASLVQETGGQYKASLTLPRRATEATDMIQGKLREQVFTEPAGTPLMGPTKKGIVIVRTKKVMPGDFSKDEDTLAKFSNRIEGWLSDDIIDQFMNALEKQYKAEINDRVLDSI